MTEGSPGPGAPSGASTGLLTRLKSSVQLRASYEDVSFPLAPKSLWFLSKQNPVRQACIKIINLPIFDVILLSAIVANCITLALDSNRPGFETTTMGHGLSQANYVFIGLFTAEAALKITALGFALAPNTYLRDGWNWLDFLVVCMSFLDFTSLGNFTAIRSVRVLRPLRTITKIPQMRIIVSTLIRSLPMMVDVMALACFYFAVFGVATLQLYAGKLNYRCGAPDFTTAVWDAATGQLNNVSYVVDATSQDDVCAGPITSQLVWSNSSGVPIAVSGLDDPRGGRICNWFAGPPNSAQLASAQPYGTYCTAWVNPGAGEYRSFDNMAMALLTVFQILTMTDWVFIMYNCQDALSWWVWPLHVVMVILGPMFIIALALAVLYLFFTKDRAHQLKSVEDDKQRQVAQGDAQQRMLGYASSIKQRERGSSIQDTSTSKQADSSAAAAAAGLQEGTGALGDKCAKLVLADQQDTASGQSLIGVGVPTVESSKHEDTTSPPPHHSLNAKLEVGPIVGDSMSSIGLRPGATQTAPAVATVAVDQGYTSAPVGESCEHYSTFQQVPEAGVLRWRHPSNLGPGLATSMSGQGKRMSHSSVTPVSMSTLRRAPVAESREPIDSLLLPQAALLQGAVKSTGSSHPVGAAARDSMVAHGGAMQHNSGSADQPGVVAVHHRHPLRRKVNHLVRGRTFEFVCTAVIVLNAVTMAIIWYKMPVSLDNATNYANYVFTIFFAIEMVLKLIGLGVRGYCSDGMSWFDALVTVAGVVEMAIDLSPVNFSGSYLTVLRAFRLLRVFRLARSWKSLNRIIKVLLSSLMAVSWLTGLLLLFIFIWSLLGLQFFGYGLASCSSVPGASQQCPPGLSVLDDCPATWDCYLPCSATQSGSWFAADGSPYGGQAFCEQFPRSYVPGMPGNDPSWPVYMAQVGKPDLPRANFDNIFNAIITVFQVLTLDNWVDVMEGTMRSIAPATALFYVTIIIIGCYMLLNLFLAILLDNLGQVTEANVNDGSKSDPGSLKSMAGDGAGDHDDLDSKSEAEEGTGGIKLPPFPAQGSRKPGASFKDGENKVEGGNRDAQKVAKTKSRRISGLAVGPDGMLMKKLVTLNTSFWVPAKQQRQMMRALRQSHKQASMAHSDLHTPGEDAGDDDEDCDGEGEEYGDDGYGEGEDGAYIPPDASEMAASWAHIGTGAAHQPGQQQEAQGAAAAGIQSSSPAKLRLPLFPSGRIHPITDGEANGQSNQSSIGNQLSYVTAAGGTAPAEGGHNANTNSSGNHALHTTAAGSQNPHAGVQARPRAAASLQGLMPVEHNSAPAPSVATTHPVNALGPLPHHMQAARDSGISNLGHLQPQQSPAASDPGMRPSFMGLDAAMRPSFPRLEALPPLRGSNSGSALSAVQGTGGPIAPPRAQGIGSISQMSQLPRLSGVNIEQGSRMLQSRMLQPLPPFSQADSPPAPPPAPPAPPPPAPPPPSPRTISQAAAVPQVLLPTPRVLKQPSPASLERHGQGPQEHLQEGAQLNEDDEHPFQASAPSTRPGSASADGRARRSSYQVMHSGGSHLSKELLVVDQPAGESQQQQQQQQATAQQVVQAGLPQPQQVTQVSVPEAPNIVHSRLAYLQSDTVPALKSSLKQRAASSQPAVPGRQPAGVAFDAPDTTPGPGPGRLQENGPATERTLKSALSTKAGVSATGGGKARTVQFGGGDVHDSPRLTEGIVSQFGPENAVKRNMSATSTASAISGLSQVSRPGTVRALVAPSEHSLAQSNKSFVTRALERVVPLAIIRQPTDDAAAAGQVHIHDILHGAAFGVFTPRNWFRMQCARVVANKYFEGFVLLLILASSVQLSLDSYDVDNGSQLDHALHIMDIIFCVLFGLEMLLKLMVLGVINNGPGSYFRSSWNILDAVIVVIQVVVLVVESAAGGANISWLHAFRALRALRVLRAASRIESIRIVVTAVLRAIPAVGDVVLVGLLFYFIFAVLATNLLLGGMFACNSVADGSMLDAYYLLPDGQTINSTWCLQDQGQVTINSSYYHSAINQSVPAWNISTIWQAHMMRFDNVAQAVWTLFQMASLEGWSDVMYAASDVVGPEKQPVRGSNQYISFFFILFIVFCSFFMLNMIIGVSIDKFHTMKEEAGGSLLLTEQQQQWLNIQKLLTATRLTQRWVPPTQAWRMPAYKLVYGTSHFDNVMLGIIVLNVVTMCMVHAGQSDAWSYALSISNIVFTTIFALEMLLKWTAVGIRQYVSDAWNIFDGVVVAVSILGVILDYTQPHQLTFLPLLRIVRVARVFRLIPKARGLRMLLTTLLWSLPALINVGSMLFMFMFMYAVIGMQLFGNIMYQQNITRQANFRSFPTAMLTLFRCVTGENWDALMQDCMVRENCLLVQEDVTLTFSNGAIASYSAGAYVDPTQHDVLDAMPGGVIEDQCSVAPFLSVLFFCTYMVLCAYLLLQLVIAVVIDNVQEQYEMEEMVIHQEHIWSFVDTWEVLDQAGSGFIDVYELTALLEAVPAPLGVKGLDFTPKRVMEISLSTQVPLHGLQVHFIQTLHALAGRVAGAELPEDAEFTIHNRLVQRLPVDVTPPKYCAGHYYAAMYVKAAVKGFLARRMMAPLYEALEAKEAALASPAHGGGQSQHSRDLSNQDSSRRRMPRLPTIDDAQRQAVLRQLTQLCAHHSFTKDHGPAAAAALATYQEPE